jgi:hypothetical protein
MSILFLYSFMFKLPWLKILCDDDENDEADLSFDSVQSYAGSNESTGTNRDWPKK